MNSDLPATGTAALPDLLVPFVPDDFINAARPQGYTGGGAMNTRPLNAIGCISSCCSPQRTP